MQVYRIECPTCTCGPHYCKCYRLNSSLYGSTGYKPSLEGAAWAEWQGHDNPRSFRFAFCSIDAMQSYTEGAWERLASMGFEVVIYDVSPTFATVIDDGFQAVFRDGREVARVPFPVNGVCEPAEVA